MEAEDASESQDWRFRCMGQENMRRLLRCFVGQRSHYPFKRQFSYKRFRRRIVQRSSADTPVASTPLTAGWQHVPRCDFDSVCQRLALDSPPRDSASSASAQDVTEGKRQGIPTNTAETGLEAGGVMHSGAVTPPAAPCAMTARDTPEAGNAPEQVAQGEMRNALRSSKGWMWTAAVQGSGNALRDGTGDETGGYLQPFAALNKASMGPQGKAMMTLAAPSLLNDYYTNLLDCSCNGMVALALGSSVYLWNSETLSLEGRLHPSPALLTLTQPGPPGRRSQAISSLRWSRDGRALSIGTRQGEIQLWDVESKSSVRYLASHLSVVGALSWKQPFLSSGSVLGQIHHHDPRAPTPLVGVAQQQGAVCSLEWSPGDDLLASGSADGVLSVWDGDITGLTRSRQPIVAMRQPSAVKAMGWCPWQRKLIATGGGWRDGELRIWDSQSGICINSAHTNSQICSLRWVEKKRCLVTGHGPPHHHITCWAWKFPSVSPSYQLAGHSHRVLHLTLNPCGTLIFSAGADQRVHVWAM